MTRFPSRTAALLLAAAAAVTLAAGSTSLVAKEPQRARSRAELAARAQIDRSFTISPDATVRVRGIGGPVSIETTAGPDTAEVHVVRMAETERELRCYRTEISSSPDLLSIEHVQMSDEPGCDSIRSRQEVRLRVPRSVDVDISTVAGGLDVGPTDGMVTLDSIAGRTRLAGVRSAQINSLAGGLSLAAAPLAAGGIRISSVVGPVELSLPANLDAELRVDSVMGSVRSASPGLELDKSGGGYRARLGAGTRAISLSSVVGPVTVTRR